MAERTALFPCDPEMLKRLLTLFQEIWAAHQAAPGPSTASRRSAR